MKISSLIAPLAIWIVTLAVPLTILFRPAANAWAVLKNPVSTAGVVTELRRDDHRIVVAQYEVEGAAYYCSTSLSENVGIPAFDRLQLGEKVPIVYRAGHPESV